VVVEVLGVSGILAGGVGIGVSIRSVVDTEEFNDWACVTVAIAPAGLVSFAIVPVDSGLVVVAVVVVFINSAVAFGVSTGRAFAAVVSAASVACVLCGVVLLARPWLGFSVDGGFFLARSSAPGADFRDLLGFVAFLARVGFSAAGFSSMISTNASTTHVSVVVVTFASSLTVIASLVGVSGVPGVTDSLVCTCMDFSTGDADSPFLDPLTGFRRSVSEELRFSMGEPVMRPSSSMIFRTHHAPFALESRSATGFLAGGFSFCGWGISQSFGMRVCKSSTQASQSHCTQ